MKLQVLAAALVACFLLQVGASSAITTLDQARVSLIVERGGEHSFQLIVKDVTEVTDLTSSGEASPWVRFGGARAESYKVYPSIADSVEVTVSVPEGAELRDYTAKIMANGKELSELEIRVTLSLEDIKSLLELSKVMMEIEELRSEIQIIRDEVSKELNYTMENVTVKIEEISERQENITALEAENNLLMSRLSQLEERAIELEANNQRLLEITGQVTVGRPLTNFGIGFIGGGAAFIVFMRRRRITEILMKYTRKRKARPGKKYEYGE